MASSVDRRPSLAELASRFQLTVAGADAATRIVGICALEPGRAGHITFAETPRQAPALARTAAGAVIVPEALAARAPVPVLVSARPRLVFARIAALFEPAAPAPGVHPSAVVAADAQIAATAYIGPRAVVGARAVLGARAAVGPGSVIGADVVIGEAATVAANVSIEARTRLGARTRVEAGAVLGARGFGLVDNGHGWEAVPQLGGLIIGDDVEIGAGTTIDRGAIDDTIIQAGVKIDNQVHIGHNCVVGAHTVIAGATGIAGSAVIGAGCLIGGGTGIGDHVRIADGVVLTAASQVPQDIATAGVYSSTFRALPARAWRRRLALFCRLDRIQRRLARLERRAASNGEPQ